MLLALLTLISWAAVTGVVAIVLMVAVYQCSPPCRHWMEQTLLFPAAAASRRGAWTKDPRYWEFVSPKDRIAPRGCDGAARPPFDQPAPLERAKGAVHRSRGGPHRRGPADHVPALIPA